MRKAPTAQIGGNHPIRVAWFNGETWSLLHCQPHAGGVLKDNHGREFSVGLCTPLADDLYVLAADRVSLLAESDFHQTRRQIVFRSMFENNSDIMDMLRQAAFIACLVIAVLVWFSVQGIAGDIHHLVK